jgi:hypothetical protein
MLGGCQELLDHKPQELAETDTHHAADPAQRDALQQESCNEGTLLLRDHRIFRIEHKGPAAPFTAMILFAGMDMAVSLKP